MHAVRETELGTLPTAQAAELALVVELEARWENLRPQAPAGGADTRALQGVQKAYDAFHGKLRAYNKRYAPAHVPELLLNTPPRLAGWCRAMRALYLRVEHDPQAPGPVHLVDKAYRWVERISARLHRGPIPRPAPPVTTQAALDALGEVARWCEDLAAATA